MNLRKLQLKDNISSIVLTEKSTLEQFILKYKLQMEVPTANILLRTLNIDKNYIYKYYENEINNCITIIDLKKIDNRKCYGGESACQKCPLYIKNKNALELLIKEVKQIKNDEDPK